MKLDRRLFLMLVLCLVTLFALAGCGKGTSADKTGNDSATGQNGQDNAAGQNDKDSAAGQNDKDSAAGQTGKDSATDGNGDDTATDRTDEDITASGNGKDATTNGDGTSGNSTDDLETAAGGDPGVSEGDSKSNSEMSELIRLYTLTVEGMQPVSDLKLPADSSTFSAELATGALSLCSQGTGQMMKKLLASSGFEVLMQAGYDKDKSDPSHTCAFTLAKKNVNLNGKDRDLLLISIRGTDSGEWFSNFDFAASHSDDTSFAENFLQAAQDVYVRILPTLLQYPDAVLLVCGHSRGAACANLLGMTLDDLRSKENVYVYTFATPATVRGDLDTEKYTNIFNLINPADLVTYLPIASWGYRRIGNDLILSGDPDIAARLKNDMDTLGAFVPSISDYYERKIKVDGLEGFEDGITAYETMLAMASSMTGIECKEIKGLNVTDIYKLAGSGSAAGELYPLINFMKNMVGLDGNMNINVFKQHMPAVYRELIMADNP